nr:hypothetical protein [uncultured Mediterranean phage uvMED]
MAIKFLNDLDVQGTLDLNDNQLLNFKVQHLAADPSGVEGQIYYNTSDNVLKYHDGSDWVNLSSATGDITEVIGGNNIDVSGGASGAATVNLDSSTISAIQANTAKTGITSSQASAITANTAKTGITGSQASAITANTAKTSNITTNLSVTQNGTSLTVNSSDGTNASLPVADTNNWGVLSDELFDEIQANTAKDGISSAQSTKLGHISVSQAVDLDTMESNISTNNAKTGISSSQATAIQTNSAKNTYPSADATKVGFITVTQDVDLDTMESNIATNNSKTGITSGQASAITANTAKNTNVSTNLSVTSTGDTLRVNSSDGDNATLPLATTNTWGVMSDEMFDTLAAAAPKASPALTGTPTAPTAAANTNTTQIATTAYVQTEITDLIGGAPGALDTLNELAAAIDDDASYASTITSALGGKSPTAGSTSLTTVGTIGTGVWQGTAISTDYIANTSGTNTGDESAASTTVAGVVERATNTEADAGSDTSRYVTPAHLARRTFTTTIGNGSLTSIAVTHNLGTRNVIVQMYDSSSYETVYAEVVRNSTSQVTIDFNSAPASNDVTVLISLVQ